MLDKDKNRNVSDAELDALLAAWAEAEMEPPAGFHEQTMKRLHAEAQPKKKKKGRLKSHFLTSDFPSTFHFLFSE